jgi:hypothetical protein
VKVSGDGATKRGRQWPAGVLSNIDALNERFSCHPALYRDLSQPKPVFGFEPQGRLVAVNGYSVGLYRSPLAMPAGLYGHRPSASAEKGGGPMALRAALQE